MLLTARFKQKEGEKGSLTLFFDGEGYDPGVSLSRLLTDTTHEDGYGIFEDEGEERFFKNGITVSVEFQNSINKMPKKTSEDLAFYLLEIKKRIEMVRAAFSKEYPEIDTSASIEI